MSDFGKPRSYPAAQSLRQTEPYHFQRQRDSMRNSYPRPAQPNTFQPNAKVAPSGWGMSTKSYWQSVMSDYMKRKGMGREL